MGYAVLTPLPPGMSLICVAFLNVPSGIITIAGIFLGRGRLIGPFAVLLTLAKIN